jgi:HSP20 family protein
MAQDSDDAFDRVEEFRREISRMIRQFYVDGNPLCVFSRKEWLPPTDVYETDEAVVAKMEVAGMKKEDLGVILEGNRLILFGQREGEPIPRTATFHQMEIKYTRFHREFLMPPELDEESIEAVYQDGFLTVRLPKTDERRQKESTVKIEIQG